MEDDRTPDPSSGTRAVARDRAWRTGENQFILEAGGGIGHLSVPVGTPVPEGYEVIACVPWWAGEPGQANNHLRFGPPPLDGMTGAEARALIAEWRR